MTLTRSAYPIRVAVAVQVIEQGKVIDRGSALGIWWVSSCMAVRSSSADSVTKQHRYSLFLILVVHQDFQAFRRPGIVQPP